MTPSSKQKTLVGRLVLSAALLATMAIGCGACQSSEAPVSEGSLFPQPDASHPMGTQDGGGDESPGGDAAAPDSRSPGVEDSGAAVEVDAGEAINEVPRSPYPAGVLDDRPIAYYRISEHTGERGNDESGNNAHARYRGSFRLGAGGAVLGGENASIAFDGEPSGWVEMPATVSPWSSDFSAEAWVTLHDKPEWRDILFTNEEYRISGFRFGVTRDLRPVFWSRESGGDGLIFGNTSLSMERWHHLALVRRGSGVALFLDGERVAEGPATIVGNQRRGRWGSYGGNSFAGRLDEIAVYDHALTADQIRNHFSSRDACETSKSRLVDSGPVRAARHGQVIENLRIRSSGQPGVLVDGFRDVVVRNCEIFHEGAHGIQAIDAPRLRVEDVVLMRTGTPECGGSFDDSRNMHISRSDDVRIARVRAMRGAMGIYVVHSANPYLNQVEIHEARGFVERASGHGIQVNHCNGAILEDFSVQNDLASTETADNISNHQSSNTIIRRGLVDGNNHWSGCALQTEHDEPTGPRSSVALYEDVDAINQQCCFAAFPGNNVTMRRLRCRDTWGCPPGQRGADGYCTCDDPPCGPGCRPGARTSLAWAIKPTSTDIAIEDFTYYNVVRVKFDGGLIDASVWEQELQEQDFVPRDPIRLNFCFEAMGPEDIRVDPATCTCR